MNEVVIRCQGLSKRYRIGQHEAYKALRDVLTDAMTAPFRRLSSSLHRGSTTPNRNGHNTFWALKDISFEVKRGEVIGIIGRNGAGKSTLLKIFSRITKPTEGFAEINGRVGSLLEVGTGFHPELTGRENIYLNGAILGMKKKEIERKFDEIVAFAEIDQFLDTPVKHYSSGMYVRLAFAVAAHLEPEILVVDEVLAVGDAGFQKKCLGKMKDVSRSGRTVIFVSHNMTAVRSLCTGAIVLHQGRVVSHGDVDQCISVYSLEKQFKPQKYWERPVTEQQKTLVIQSVNAELSGQQPHYSLNVEITLKTQAQHAKAFISIDVLDSYGHAIMQALPTMKGFVNAAYELHKVKATISLPPLVPDDYSLTVWVGSHNTETLDEVRECVGFHINESPTPGRTVPHTAADHGYIVPYASFEYHCQ